jgi:capsular polysaccharide biosynthesis protein
MVVIAFVVSLFIGIFAAFGKEYVEKVRRKTEESGR